MNNKNFSTYFDCGFSKIRAGTFNKDDPGEFFLTESRFLSDHLEIDSEIQKIITFLEKSTDKYLADANLMIDSPNMLSIAISVSKKIDELKVRQEDIQFLIQKAKQQILKSYNNQNIIHIIINNYKVDKVDYSYFPEDIRCNFISLDILFICLPNEIIDYYKNLFHKFDIAVNRILCSSYAKSVNYKDNFSLDCVVSFIDIGFNKTSITFFKKGRIVSLTTLPIGGNHITKDISKILKIDLGQAEQTKCNLGRNKDSLNNSNFSLDLLVKIACARVEEILEICAKSIKLNLFTDEQFKMILMGEGSKILDNKYKDKIPFSYEIDFLEETTEDICNSGFKIGLGLNKQEIFVKPKKQKNLGFFEKLFHFFR